MQHTLVSYYISCPVCSIPLFRSFRFKFTRIECSITNCNAMQLHVDGVNDFSWKYWLSAFVLGYKRTRNPIALCNWRNVVSGFVEWSFFCSSVFITFWCIFLLIFLGNRCNYVGRDNLYNSIMSSSTIKRFFLHFPLIR